MDILKDIQEILNSAKEVVIPEKREDFFKLALGGGNDYFEVKYEVPGNGEYVEATVAKVKNGIVVNYPDVYMRRRDPDALVVGDDLPSDKPRFKDAFGFDFSILRRESLDWFKGQEIIFMPFFVGGEELNYQAALIAPKNAGFFAGALADIQGFIPKSRYEKMEFKPRAVIYAVPPFRHKYFGTKQVVVHNRVGDSHEVFSYNLYPGPSAKKGVYSILLHFGEFEGWVTIHAATVRMVSPYDNVIVITHEGASGGGKSELTQQMQFEKDEIACIGTHIKTGEKLYIEMKELCEIHPVTDDMAVVHPALQNGSGKMVLKDAEEAWFVRTDNIPHYGSDPHLEKMTIHPKEPLIFLNIDAVPNSTALIWEHIMDAPGKPCPNPRVIIPRRHYENIVEGHVEVDIRSFGVRTPPCTKESPSYGIIGIVHILPPALAWLWRLASPRGYANPSITESKALESEGVGSYWPFATGKKVKQANLLLKQFLEFTKTSYLLIPNQHIGAYKVGFMPEWLMREYFTKRGGVKLRPDQVVPSKCSLLGYALEYIKMEGVFLPKFLLQVDLQPDVGEEGFMKGAQILKDFFKKTLKEYLTDELDPLGREIIQCCLDDGTIQDYENLIKSK